MWYYIDGHWILGGLAKYRFDEGIALLARQSDYKLISCLSDLVDSEIQSRSRRCYPNPASYLEPHEIFLVKIPALMGNFPWGLGFHYSWKDVPWYRLVTADKLPGARPFPEPQDLPPHMRYRPTPANPQRASVLLD